LVLLSDKIAAKRFGYEDGYVIFAALADRTRLARAARASLTGASHVQ
jgi:hypothetical protein